MQHAMHVGILNYYYQVLDSVESIHSKKTSDSGTSLTPFVLLILKKKPPVVTLKNRVLM
jgi:hypothetical protein